MVSSGQNWSTDDMRASADNWSLANDVNLREYLVNDPDLILPKSIYSGDLNNELVRYSNGQK